MNILILGTGLQGRAALHDLAATPAVHHVIAADVDLAALTRYLEKLGSDKIEAVRLDASDHDQVAALMRRSDAVIELLPVSFHVAMAELAVENGVHLVNASYAPPEFRALGEKAAARGLAILPEMGFDPGIDLVLAGQAIRELDEVHFFYSYGAGFPEPAAAGGPLRYKISWTFDGVLRSYLRAARVIRGGQIVDVPGREVFAAANIHTADVAGIGALEAYPNGDVVHYVEALGLAGSVTEAGRFSMRWPGHSAFWYALAQTGFLDDRPIQVDGVAVQPRSFVRSLLEPQLQYGPGERDVAVIRVDVRGLKDGRRLRLIYEVVDFRDLESGLLAMNRTVGYTASIAAQMLLRGEIQGRGLLSPLRDVPFAAFSAELRRRGIIIKRTAEES